MSDRSRRQDRGAGRDRNDAKGDAQRFTGDGANLDREELERSREPSQGPRAGESGEWRDGYGAYGFGPESPPRSDTSRRLRDGVNESRSGYGEQGFGAGEAPAASWGGGARGGYGGGQPGGTHGTRGGAWAAAGERFEQGRGARSHGPSGWGGGSDSGAGQHGGRSRHGGGPRGRSGVRRPEEYGSSVDAWATSEFAGRGEFGSAAQPSRRRQRWEVPGPYSGVGPEGYRRSEEAIRDDVCERLTRHGELDASSITVRVEKGDVVLEGIVDSRRSKRMAEETAESVTGVHDIHNRLRIDEGSFDRHRMEGRSGGGR